MTAHLQNREASSLQIEYKIEQFFEVYSIYLYKFCAENTFRVANSIIALTSN